MLFYLTMRRVTKGSKQSREDKVSRAKILTHSQDLGKIILHDSTYKSMPKMNSTQLKPEPSLPSL